MAAVCAFRQVECVLDTLLTFPSVPTNALNVTGEQNSKLEPRNKKPPSFPVCSAKAKAVSQHQLPLNIHALGSETGGVGSVLSADNAAARSIRIKLAVPGDSRRPSSQRSSYREVFSGDERGPCEHSFVIAEAV